jgi:hypothetical protein
MVLLGWFTAHCHGVWLHVHVPLIWRFGNFLFQNRANLGLFFFWRKILCMCWNYIFKVKENFPKTKTLVWRIGYTRIWKALGRIASTVFFCGEFLSILRNVFCENFGNVTQSGFFFFVEEWDKIRHILKKK